MPKTEFLVVDTSAFIKNSQLQNFSDKIVTCHEVLDEIKNSRQLRRLVVLPYDVEIDEPDNEDIIFVSQFSKRTGDYPALSSTDIKVMALTYKLERLKVGREHLNSEPPAPKDIRVIDHSVINEKSIVGFYMPEGVDDQEDEGIISDNEDDQEEVLEHSHQPVKADLEENVETDDDNEGGSSSSDEFFDTEQEVPEVDDDLINRLRGVRVDEDSEEETEGLECDQNDPCALDKDDAGWITPSNVKHLKQQTMYGSSVEDEATPIKVACLTTDFAMQNVLKQIGLNIVSIDGLLIKEVKTWILRCYACFKTTSDMTRVFCHNCGNKTLKRVAVTVDPDGKEHIHINFRRPLTARGKRFPLPRFKGGKHSNNPVLSEDQRVPQQYASRLAQKKTDPLDPDYTAGLSPFVMRDVWSRSAMLGIANSKDIKSWERRNPNVVVKRRRKK